MGGGSRWSLVWGPNPASQPDLLWGLDKSKAWIGKRGCEFGLHLLAAIPHAHVHSGGRCFAGKEVQLEVGPPCSKNPRF